VQNLLVQKMGTANGTTVSGVSIFFHSGPNVSGGTLGSAEVRNADGEGFFTTGAPQPYFHWSEVLSQNAVSMAKRWEFDTSGPDVRFQFIVYIRTELLPVVLFDRSVSGNRDIYRVALDGSDLVRMTTATGDDVNPTVGGNLVVFTSFRSGNAELWSMPLTGGAETRLTTSSAAETDPALSADGTRLAYVTNAQFGTGKVWTATPQLTGAARATPAGFGLDGAPELGPAWAPTGNHLAIVSTGAGSPDIFDYTMPGTPTLLAGLADYSEVDPAWSPDGTRIVYVSTVTGGGDLYLIRVSDGQVTQLTTREGADAAPTWLRDGRIVYQAWLSSSVVELRWLNPGNPADTGTIPVPAGGGRIDRPYAVPF
jgi:TolB protein